MIKNCNINENFFLKKMYLIFLTIFIIFLYPLRIWILLNNPSQYELQYIDYIPFKIFSINQLPLKDLLIFILILYLIGLLIPQKIKLNKIPQYKFFLKIFYIQNVLYTLILLFGFYTMGKEMGLVARILLGLVDGILGRDFIFLIIIIGRIQSNKKITKYFLIYSLPSIIMGSKSGIIIGVIYSFTILIGFNKKIFKVRYLIIIIISYLSYPLLYAISWVIRLGGKIDKTIFENFSIYTPLELISKRVNAVDILMANKDKIIDIEKFSIFSTFEKIMSAILTRGFVSIILKRDILPYGVIFSQEVMHQPKDVINGFEPTLFGVIYYSKNMVQTSILMVVTIIILMGIMYIISKKNFSLFLIIFLITFVITIMTGIFVNIYILFRYWIIFVILVFLLKSLSKHQQSEKRVKLKVYEK